MYKVQWVLDVFEEQVQWYSSIVVQQSLAMCGQLYLMKRLFSWNIFMLYYINQYIDRLLILILLMISINLYILQFILFIGMLSLINLFKNYLIHNLLPYVP